MPRRKPDHAASDSQRRSIAAAAARLMAEEGVTDYGAAKRKAAKNCGAGEGESLPTNEEIETELRAYQSLYQEDEQRDRLHEMREIAIAVMEFLVDFRPYLTGGVLDGTAGRYSAVELDLFADSAKDVEIFMLSRDISYETSDKGRPVPHAAHLPEARLRIDWNGVPVFLSVYPFNAERQQKKGTQGHRGPHGRAKPAEVAALLAAGLALPASPP